MGGSVGVREWYRKREEMREMEREEDNRMGHWVRGKIWEVEEKRL